MSPEISSLTLALFRNLLFNRHIFWDFPVIFLFLISSLIPWWSGCGAKGGREAWLPALRPDAAKPSLWLRTLTSHARRKASPPIHRQALKAETIHTSSPWKSVQSFIHTQEGKTISTKDRPEMNSRTNEHKGNT